MHPSSNSCSVIIAVFASLHLSDTPIDKRPKGNVVCPTRFFYFFLSRGQAPCKDSFPLTGRKTQAISAPLTIHPSLPRPVPHAQNHFLLLPGYLKMCLTPE